MTRMTMPRFWASSVRRLPSLRKTSGLGYCAIGMSFGRMNGCAMYRPPFPDARPARHRRRSGPGAGPPPRSHRARLVFDENRLLLDRDLLGDGFESHALTLADRPGDDPDDDRR